MPSFRLIFGEESDVFGKPCLIPSQRKTLSVICTLETTRTGYLHHTPGLKASGHTQMCASGIAGSHGVCLVQLHLRIGVSATYGILQLDFRIPRIEFDFFARKNTKGQKIGSASNISCIPAHFINATRFDLRVF
ncbi:hypothetical protein ACRALDRAFT_205041 [Sodiomyces alcalophilus JCM 7366]|uniref:uncharacterized protein n=1 Tax=Sodiomyces alcalophilus JCM 7366 TaxID=591952 RepID=UPI0039B47A0B